METIDNTQTDTRKRLPVLGAKANVDIDVEAELKKFEIEQMAALGLEAGKEHWRDDNPTTFTGGQRAHTTLLRMPQLAQSIFIREMHDVDRRPCHIR